MRNVFFVALTLILLPTLVLPQETVTDSLVVEIDYNDGPYVFWQDDSTAIVFYVCGDTLSTYTFFARDTLRFDGLCLDSNESYVISVNRPTVEPHIIDGVPRILAVSDIHGEYEYLVDILKNSGIIDSAFNWIWGDGHLVVAGDIFDRGDRVTECLWLIHKLERQARQSGGRVHFILGNHELMVLQGDNRYVHERYLDGIARKSRIKHEDLYGPEMELGRWLRSKHTAIKLNNILFVHGGLSPLIIKNGWSLSFINEACRDKIDLRSSRIAFDGAAQLLFGGKGPLWYRGYHYGMEGRYDEITGAEVDSILNHYGVEAIVVGHTDNGHMVTLYDKKIYGIDVDYEGLGCLQALLWQDNQFFKITGDGLPHQID